MTGTVVFSVGCHSGLPIPGDDNDKGQLDFAQVLMGRGAMYVANTGYGYGDANAIGYSEHLMQLFVRQMRDMPAATVGKALTQAKSEYFNTLGHHALTPYDEKVLAVATFYGFPMVEIRFPEGDSSQRAQPEREQNAQLSPLSTCPEGLTCREATFTPIYATQSVTDGTYFSVEGETQESPGQPILPRTSQLILETSITNTLQLTVARGALFEGGHYETFTNFDPVITRIITENRALREQELPYFVEAWRPAEWERINSLRTGEQIIQRLVILPAQYRATRWGASEGIIRRFTDMTYTIYYSATHDTIPPSIWQVATTLIKQRDEPEQLQIEIDVTDFSSVARTVIAHTTGNGEWQSTDLEQIGDSNIWQGHLPYHPQLTYFVQAVDRAGNVALHDNKGHYFMPPIENIYYITAQITHQFRILCKFV